MVKSAKKELCFVVFCAILFTAVLAAPLTHDAKEIDKRRETTKEILKLESTLKKSAGENKHIFPSRLEDAAAGDEEEQLQVDALEDVKRSMRLPLSSVTKEQKSEPASASSTDIATETNSEEKVLSELLAPSQHYKDDSAKNSAQTADFIATNDEDAARGDAEEEQEAEGEDEDTQYEYQWGRGWEENGSHLHPEEELSHTNPRWSSEQEDDGEYAYDGGYYGDGDALAEVAADVTADDSSKQAAVDYEDPNSHATSNTEQKSATAKKSFSRVPTDGYMKRR